MEFKNCFVITGSIATGKSSVCAILRDKNYMVVDADIIAHEELAKHSSQIAFMFGESILSDGVVDRKRLGKIVFANSEAKSKLENFLHPKIRVSIMQKIAELDKSGQVFFVDIPLFFETNAYDLLNIVVVYAPREVQLSRLVQRENMSAQEAVKRVEMQMDIEEKRLRAKYIIDNSNGTAGLITNVNRFLENIGEK